MLQAKVLMVMGTRPEAIKLLPLLKLLKNSPEFDVRLLVTGQHRELLQKTLKPFGMDIDWDLELMQSNQGLEELSARCLSHIPNILREFSPHLVIVQGDTTTAFMAGLSSFYQKIPVAHIEAGLRTGDRHSPFPEEMNRIFLSSLSEIHLCPTQKSKENLISEGISAHSAFVTGNTSIDSLKDEWDGNHHFPALENLVESHKLCLITAHRRENFGAPMANLFRSIRKIAYDSPEFQFVFPVHPNPVVSALAQELLGNHERIHLIEPVNYSELVFLLRHSCVVLTDSGGIQEEAPTLGIQTLILRDNTERPEALQTGFAQLVGTQPERLYQAFMRLRQIGAFNQKAQWVGGPFGDGRAASRIVEILKGWWFSKLNHSENFFQRQSLRNLVGSPRKDDLTFFPQLGTGHHKSISI